MNVYERKETHIEFTIKMHRDMFYMSDTYMQQSFMKDHRTIQIFYKAQETYTSLEFHEEESGFVGFVRRIHISPYFAN
jgi:hypothetical protein